LTWTVAPVAPDAQRLKLTWQERNGPRVAAPQRHGFGTRLIEQALGGDPDGRIELSFAPSGVVCTIEAVMPLPTETVEARPDAQ
jgi:two-component sensor histidine kinase